MIAKFIGRWLFPRLPAWEQQRRARTGLWVVGTTVSVACAIGLLMFWFNSKR